MFSKSIPLLFTACALMSLNALGAPSAAKPDSKERSRIEELFIWRTSEELRLAPIEEQKFTEAIHALNKRRREANERMDAALVTLSNAKTKAAAEKALAGHGAALREVHAVQLAEIDKLRRLLGPEKLAQYLVEKNSILEKLKTMLAAPQEPASSSAPPLAGPASSSAGSSAPSSASGATSAAPSFARVPAPKK